jgi:putative two-component system response regulator
MHLNDRILAVDDTVENLEVLSELLGGEYTVETASSGEEALKKAERFRPDLILLDVMMPGMDGHEVCRAVRAMPILADTKIVMLSARTDIGTRLTSYDAGAVDYMSKPFDHEEVKAKVKAWMQMVYHQQLDAIWHDVEEAHDAVGSAMLSLSAFRDLETGEHLFRMRWYTLLLAEQLAYSGPYRSQIDETFLRDIYRASPLHDIGKVAIADAILCKPGPLTKDEYEIMKQHSVLGADMLSGAAKQFPAITYLSMAAEIARHHHERFDGSGYPDGLAGEKIPLAARIVCVADAFDAMTSPRVYKAARALNEAIEQVETGAGRHFDPVVVAAFMERVEDIRQAHPRFTFGPAQRFDDLLIGAH